MKPIKQLYSLEPAAKLSANTDGAYLVPFHLFPVKHFALSSKATKINIRQAHLVRSHVKRLDTHWESNASKFFGNIISCFSLCQHSGWLIAKKNRFAFMELNGEPVR